MHTTLFCLIFNIFLHAHNVGNHINMRPVGMVVIAATAPRRRLLAGTTHMAPVHHVTESLEGAVVFAPTVLYLRMAETHVVVE